MIRFSIFQHQSITNQSNAGVSASETALVAAGCCKQHLSGHYQCSLDLLCTGSQDLLWVEPVGWTRLGEITAHNSDCGSQALFPPPLCAQEIIF